MKKPKATMLPRKPKAQMEFPSEALDTLDDPTASFDERRHAMQVAINSGRAWRLEGSFGRAAMDAIKAGHCALGTEATHDFYGNFIGSRYDVVPGTKGSEEYVNEHGFDVLD